MAKSKTLLTYYAFALLCVSSVFIFLFILSPAEQQTRVVDENSAIENATALFYLFTVAFCIWQGAAARRWVWLALGGLALLSFLDEVGFGLSFFHLPAPTFLQRYPIDGIHDFVKVVIKEVRRQLRKGNNFPYYVLAAGGVFLLSGLVVFRKKFWTIANTLKEKHALSLVFFTVFVVFGVLSQAIDAVEIFPLAMKLMEELLELNASLVLAFCAVSLRLE